MWYAIWPRLVARFDGLVDFLQVIVMRHVISALVTNEPGVLSLISGLFSARGFNIDSLVVGRTVNPDLSRLTIVVTGDDNTLEQVRWWAGVARAKWR